MPATACTEAGGSAIDVRGRAGANFISEAQLRAPATLTEIRATNSCLHVQTLQATAGQQAAALPIETPFARASQVSGAPSAPLDDVYEAVLDAAQYLADVDAQAIRLQASLPAWHVQLHMTRTPDVPRKPFTPLILHNTFLTAAHTVAPAKETLIIDFNFRHHFELPGIASQAYGAALSEVPDVFVGQKAQLEALVADIYQPMQREYKAKVSNAAAATPPPWPYAQQ